MQSVSKFDERVLAVSLKLKAKFEAMKTKKH